MLIIPAIDIIGGRCVRLAQGKYNRKKVYRKNPVQIAKEFIKNGAKKIHVVDLKGAKEGALKELEILEMLGSLKVKIQFGGGIRNLEDLEILKKIGMDKIILGTNIIKNPKFLDKAIKKFRKEKIIVSIDIIKNKIGIKGWEKLIDINVFKLIKRLSNLSITQIIITEIEKDGMMKGIKINIIKKLIKQFPNIDFYYAGGIKTGDDIRKLKNIGTKGVIIGKALYEKKLNLKQLIDGFQKNNSMS